MSRRRRRRGTLGWGLLAPLVVVGALSVPPVSSAAPAAPDGRTAVAAADPHTLWYAKPAADWEKEALPIGNGAMGAMVSGGVGEEKLQFNEKTLWTGGPGSAGYNFGNWNSPRPTAIQEGVDTINTQGKADPSWVAEQARPGPYGLRRLSDLRRPEPGDGRRRAFVHELPPLARRPQRGRRCAL
ncbi:glycoside hydrolase N-terminal domain-containing protein [Streptomyces indonesiensis]